MGKFHSLLRIILTTVKARAFRMLQLHLSLGGDHRTFIHHFSQDQVCDSLSPLQTAATVPFSKSVEKVFSLIVSSYLWDDLEYQAQTPDVQVIQF